jgi:hypothetical protein
MRRRLPGRDELPLVRVYAGIRRRDSDERELVPTGLRLSLTQIHRLPIIALESFGTSTTSGTIFLHVLSGKIERLLSRRISW